MLGALLHISRGTRCALIKLLQLYNKFCIFSLFLSLSAYNYKRVASVMSQYHHQQNYNQYTDPHQESSLNIEDQSGVAPPTWNSGPDSSNSTGAPSYGSGPPVQPMYSSESQYQHPGLLNSIAICSNLTLNNPALHTE